MCHVLFVAAPVEIPLRARTDPPTLSVDSVDDANPVLGHFPVGWCVRCVGAHTGCACGFHSQPRWLDEQTGPQEGLGEAMQSRRRLAGLVASLSEAGPVRLYGCWNGDEALPEVTTKTVPPAWLSSARSPVPDGYALIIDPAAPCPLDEDAWMDVPPINGIVG